MTAGASTPAPRRPGLVLQNEHEAPPALLERWLRERGIPHTTVRAWEQGVPEDPRGHSWIAVLGAENSVTDDDPPWIAAEIELLGRAVEADVPVLGICFGGQALSLALGGEISSADPPCHGWYGIETDEPRLLPPGPWAHYNSESFSVPEVAAQIATSPCGPGAFRLGPHLGVQFHPEATPAIVDEWAEMGAETLRRRGFDRDEIRAQGVRHGARAAEQAFALFDAWIRGIDGA